MRRDSRTEIIGKSCACEERGGGLLRLLLVDDNIRFREAFARVLELQPDLEVVAQAGSVAEAYHSLEGIDVALLDLHLPDGDGRELVAPLREASPAVAVLILTASLDPNLRRTNEIGADGIIDKMAAPGESIGAIRRLGGG